MEKNLKNPQNAKKYLITKLAEIKNITELEKISFLIKTRLEILIAKENVEKEKIIFIVNNWIPIFLTYYNKEIIIKKHSLNVIELIIELDIIPIVFKKNIMNIYLKYLNLLYGLKKTHFAEKKNFYLKEKFTNSLNILLNIKEYNSFVKNKNYGYSLLDLNGNFLFLDKLSKNLFEYEKETFRNFFDILTPFSQNMISRKYNNGKNNLYSIFTERNCCDFINLSYIIYSKKNLKKYIDILRKKNKSKKLNSNKNRFDETKTIFYKYLKALTSRFVLVKIDFEEKLLQKINEEKIFLNFTNFFRDDYKYSGNGKNFKIGVLMETRLSNKIPDFDFELMKDDEKILEFDEVVKKFVKGF